MNAVSKLDIYNIGPPFKASDAGRGALRQVLISAGRSGLGFQKDFAQIAHRILQSRWYVATLSLAQSPRFAAHLAVLKSDDDSDPMSQTPPFTDDDRDIYMLIAPIFDARNVQPVDRMKAVTDNILGSRWYAATVAACRTEDAIVEPEPRLRSDGHLRRCAATVAARRAEDATVVPESHLRGDGYLHGFTATGDEIRRHDEHGWHIFHIESGDIDEISVHRAADEALTAGHLIIGMPGGTVFDRTIRSLCEERSSEAVTAWDAAASRRESAEGPIEVRRVGRCWIVAADTSSGVPDTLHISAESGGTHAAFDCGSGA